MSVFVEQEGRETADADPEFAALLAMLPEAWAKVPADDDGKDTAAAFLRAAYGRGYVVALEGPTP